MPLNETVFPTLFVKSPFIVHPEILLLMTPLLMKLSTFAVNIPVPIVMVPLFVKVNVISLCVLFKVIVGSFPRGIVVPLAIVKTEEFAARLFVVRFIVTKLNVTVEASILVFPPA